MLKLKKIEFIFNNLNCLKKKLLIILLLLIPFKSPNFLRKIEILLVKKRALNLKKNYLIQYLKFFLLQ